MISLIKANGRVWIKYPLKIILMEVAYPERDLEEEDEEIFSMVEHQKMLYRRKKRLNKQKEDEPSSKT